MSYFLSDKFQEGAATVTHRSLWLLTVLFVFAVSVAYESADGAAPGPIPPPEIEASAAIPDGESLEPGRLPETKPSASTSQQVGAAGVEQSRLRRFQIAVEQGPFWMYLIVFLAGIATSLTPCVLPIIPLTIAVIGAKSVESRAKGFGLSLIYVLGIAATYSTLGVVFASTGTLLGSQFQSTPFLIFLVILFTLLAFGLFGAYQLQLPAPIRNTLMAKQGKGWFGILFMGLIAGLIASPCAGPIIAGVLLFIAQTGNIVLGFTLMFTFSMGLGLLFLVVGTFSSEIKRMPTGPWMTAIETGLGVALLAVAFYYLSLLLDTFPFVLILGATLVVGGAFAGAFTRLSVEETGWAPKTRKALGILIVATGLYFFVGGLMTYGLFLPPMSGAGPGTTAQLPAGQPGEGLPSEEAGLRWGDDLEAALFLAEMEQKPVMIDFTADWCTACKELDRYTFSDPAVIEAFQQFILVRIDMTDRSNPQNEELRRQYNILSLPSVTFLAPSGEMLPDYTVSGFVRGPEFLEILQGVLEAPKNPL